MVTGLKPMTQEPRLICVVIALTGAGCGGSGGSTNQPFAPTAISSGSPRTLVVNGRKLLSAIGETSQLTAVATWSDGTAREVTNQVRWNSHDSSVASVSSSGVAVAVGFGAAPRIDAGYEGLNNTFQISVTPTGTFGVTGDVREPGQGPLIGVRVLEPVSGKFALTDQSGNYMLAGVASTRLRFEKDGFEPGDLDIAPDSPGFMRMQRVVRITAGETAIVPKLTHMDMSYDLGPVRCFPCRLIRVVAPTAGTIRFELTWEPNAGAELYLWVGGRRFAADTNERQVTGDAAVSVGEHVVYVGYYRWATIYGSSIKFTLVTSMSRSISIPAVVPSRPPSRSCSRCLP